MNRNLLSWGMLLLALFAAQQFWHWQIERVEVPADHFLVRIKRWGKALPPDEILATGPNAAAYQGVMAETLSEGRYFLNPLFWSYEVHPYVKAEPGECIVRTRKFGKPIPPERLARGEIDARGTDDQDPERGLIAQPLLPGKHAINPYAYEYEKVPAIKIDVNEVGVRTLKVELPNAQLLAVNTMPVETAAASNLPAGETTAENATVENSAAEPNSEGAEAAPIQPNPESLVNYDAGLQRSRYVVDGGRGIQRAVVGPGTYYVNPYIENITPVEVRSHRVELHDLSFPSRDGFILTPEVIVEYAVKPSAASELLVRLTDEGQLHQDDSTEEEQQQNEILQKVILPLIRGYARLAGSEFAAREFVLTDAPAEAAVPGAAPSTTPAPTEVADKGEPPINPREVLQKRIGESVTADALALGIEVRAITLSDLHLPPALLSQISQRDLSRVELDKNQALVKQFVAQQDLAAKEALKAQATAKVGAETRMIQAETQSKQLLEVEELRLKQELTNAQTRLDAAKRQAESILAAGRAEAAVIESQNAAEVAGLKQAIAGFSGPQNFAQYHVLTKLGPALGEIFASDDSDFARLVSQYLSPHPDAAAVNKEPVPSPVTLPPATAAN